MATTRSDFQLPVHSGSHQASACVSPTEVNPLCLIHSNHPLAQGLIKDAICSNSRLRSGVKRYYAGDSRLVHGTKDQILILDTCSVDNWAAGLAKWNAEGGSAIALVSPEVNNRELELQILHLGTSGVLTFAELPVHLPNAIYAVAEGGLWFKREVLQAYVKQTSITLRKFSSSYQKFTIREKQIMELLLQELPNRLIAQKLSVSERTIKFHVSNILRKFNVGDRKELFRLISPSPAFSLHSLSGDQDACSTANSVSMPAYPFSRS